MASNNETKYVKKQLNKGLEDQHSDDSSEALVIATNSAIDIPEHDQNILKDSEQTLEENLEEKAVRNNLKISHVKNILRHVVSNAEVIAFIKDAVDPDKDPEVKYEPKFTRAKARLMYQNGTLIPWSKGEPSETEVLIKGDLHEDTSGDEYVPGEDESEDELESSRVGENYAFRDISQDPKSIDSNAETIWTEDGIFKLPSKIEDKSNPSKGEKQEDATIALRTRSKLDLIATPLEEIEKTFIPPDLILDETEEEDTADDIDQHEVDWKQFLDEFAKPLEEIVTNGDPDEEHDPEYNVLADEEIEEFDIEELRVDRGVKITRKELNQLITELVDCADNYSSYFPPAIPPAVAEEEQKIDEQPEPEIANEVIPEVVLVSFQVVAMTNEQKMLLEDQFRKHIQLLCQHFLLTHTHPEYQSNAGRCKEYMNDIKSASMGKSYYENIFVEDALELVEVWEQTFNCDTTVIKEFKEFESENILQMKQAIEGKSDFTPKFHELTLRTISNSKVFLYPSLLPRIPFTFNDAKIIGFTNSEIQLLCLGLEQFLPFLKMDKRYLKSNGDVNLREVCLSINRYMMPARKYETIYKFICGKRRETNNPIRKYFDTTEVELFVHEVTPITEAKRLPPSKRRANELSFQWQHFLFPELAPDQSKASTGYKAYQSCSCGPVTKVSKPPTYNKRFTTKETFGQKSRNRRENAQYIEADEDIITCSKSLRASLEKEPVLRNDIPQEVLNFKFNSSIFANCSAPPSEVETMSDVLDKHSSEESIAKEDDEVEVTSSQNINTEECVVDSTVVDICTDLKEEKDNLEDINALVLASSTIRPATSTIKRRQTVLEKKRAKMKRNFEENLKLLSEESPDVIAEKRNRFIQAYYDKVQETLELEDFHTFMSILNEFDDTVSSATIIYNRIRDIMGDKHPELLDEFLLFLDSAQAKSIGKLVPYIILSNMSLFLRKLEVFFQDQPPQLRKIFKALTDLSNKSDVSLEQVKQTIVPLLKGNALLNDWFLQIFPGERPPKTLVNNGAWEDIIVCKDIDPCEIANLPPTDDPYGGPNCVCKCHSSEDEALNARMKHCTHCGAKFMQGGVFLHTSKGLHPVTVTFEKDNIDHKARLAPAVKTKRADSSSSKHISPGKESHDETRHSSDEDDKKGSRGSKRGTKPGSKKKKPQSDTKKSSRIRKAKSFASASTSKKFKTNEGVPEQAPPKLMSEEQSEWEGNVSMDSVENKASPEPCQSDESECWEDLEMSQDDSDCYCQEQEQSGSSTSSTTAWTRDEDKVILKTFQSEEATELAFQRIKTLLKNRSLEEIKSRFEVLMNFLRTMTTSN